MPRSAASLLGACDLAGAWSDGPLGFIISPGYGSSSASANAWESFSAGGAGATGGSSVSDSRAYARQRERPNMDALAEELVDIILDALWRLESEPDSQPGQPQTSAGENATARTQARPQSEPEKVPSDSEPQRPDTSSGAGDAVPPHSQPQPHAGAGSSEPSGTPSPMQQQPVSHRGAAAEVRAWASYRRVCRRWDAFFREKRLALQFREPLSDAQLAWFAAAPTVVRALGFAPGECRAFRVLGNLNVQAYSGHALATLRGLPLGATSDLTHRLLAYTKLRYVSGWSETTDPRRLQFSELPPSLRSLEVVNLGFTQLRASPAPHQEPGDLSTFAVPLQPPAQDSPEGPKLREIMLASTAGVQVHPDWLSGLCGSVALEADSLVLALPPREESGGDRASRIRILAALIRSSGVAQLRLRSKELVLLDFVIAQFPVLVYVLLEGSNLVAALRQLHADAFDVKTEGDTVTISRKESPSAAAQAAAA